MAMSICSKDLVKKSKILPSILWIWPRHKKVNYIKAKLKLKVLVWENLIEMAVDILTNFLSTFSLAKLLQHVAKMN